MPYEILLSERRGRDGAEMVYVRPPESNKLSRLDASLRGSLSPLDKIWGVWREVLLPRGYPDSVSSDYMEYQIWDSLQAFASTVSHTLATHAVLVGVGVGDRQASALGAAITWIFKDGVGMLSKILFAWTSGAGFDSDCKKWRLFADVINDLAMSVELFLLPALSNYSLQVLCLSSALKAVVGVAGGATRAAVTQHQAVAENTGDVSAKDAAQETCVNLIASLVGMLILSYASHPSLVYPLFLLVTTVHLYANYRAVKCLKFKVLNSERFNIVLEWYLKQGVTMSPEAVSRMESVSLLTSQSDVKLWGREVKVGSSLEGLGLTSNQLRMISSLYKDKKFLLVQSSRYVRIVVAQGSSVKDLLQAYFHALLLALASSHSLGLALPIHSSHSPDSPYTRFTSVLASLPVSKDNKLLNIEELMDVEAFCDVEFPGFWKGLVMGGWDVDSHQLHGVDAGWRALWGPSLHQSFPNQYMS